MGSAIIVGLLGAVISVALVLLLVYVTALRGLLRRTRHEQADLRVEIDQLRGRLDELSLGQTPTKGHLPEPGPSAPSSAPSPAAAPAVPARVVGDSLVLSETVGEPLVKVAAFAHGLRRALSGQSLNQIRFEVRREVRRARKRRRRETREAWRRLQAERGERADEDAA
ncbi:MAG: hypothetical protein M3Z50_11710 [Actinomycetota bacterium]|nr:hypothetical protein [Actinomycetota bacterium]